MLLRSKEGTGPSRPESAWLTGAAIGVAISTLAAGAMLLGAGLAIVQAPTRRLPSR